ncbi:MAG: glucoamylase family protein [Gemmatimonadota bacterium]
MPLQRLLAVLCFLVAVTACDGPSPESGSPPGEGGADLSAEDVAFLDDLQRRTFDFFWETTNPANGLVPDRWPTESFSSVAAVGFGLTAYGVGAERGWVTRAEAAERVRTTLRFLADAPMGPERRGVSGHRGFYYHFLDMETGERFQTVELSTIDTALLLAGVLFAQEYFDAEGPVESEIRALADSLYLRVEWPFFQTDERGITMAWHPEPDRGFSPARWTGYDESILLHVLALGSPTHPAGPEIWDHYTSGYEWGEFYGYEHLNFPPLFGHQYSHIWIDFRGIRDDFMREKGIDYFENSRRATLAQREYAAENPDGWRGFGSDRWGLTASDGPKDTTVVIDGVERTFRQYWARGASLQDVRNDGTLVPTAAGGSIPFAPEETVAALRSMREAYGDDLYARYGFRDAYNPTFAAAGIAPVKGEVVEDVAWFDNDYLGIDQGPIVLMIENHRSGLIWDVMRDNPYIVRGLCRAGFRGGWLEGRCE